MLVGKSVTDRILHTHHAGPSWTFQLLEGKFKLGPPRYVRTLTCTWLDLMNEEEYIPELKYTTQYTHTNHSLRHAPPPFAISPRVDPDSQWRYQLLKFDESTPHAQPWMEEYLWSTQTSHTTTAFGHPSHDIRIQPPSLSCVHPRWKQLGQLLLLTLTAL